MWSFVPCSWGVRKVLQGTGTPSPDTALHIASTDRVMQALRQFPEITKAYQEKCPKLPVKLFMKAASTAFEIKTALCNLDSHAEILADSAEPNLFETRRGAMFSLCSARQVWEDMLGEQTEQDGGIAPHFDDMVENVQSMFSTRTDKLTQRAESLVKFGNKSLNNLLSRLARVAGGSDDGSSWKAGLEGEAAKGSPEFQTATEKLSQAYVSAIEARSTQLRQETRHKTHCLL